MKNTQKTSVILEGNDPMEFETGRLASQASGSILAKWGETMVLATVTMSGKADNLDYFPLTVEYIEKFYAGGIISSSKFVKRERFPSSEAILKARLIDRSIRPLFPEGFMNEVQVIVTVLSYDDIHDPAILGINAVSYALMISDVPFDGPVAGVNVGLVDGNLVVFPSLNDIENNSALDLVVSSTKDAIVMLEAGANEVDEAKLQEAMILANKSAGAILDSQVEFAKLAGKEKVEYNDASLDKDLVEKIKGEFIDDFKNAITADKSKFRHNEEELKAKILEKYETELSKSVVSEAVFHILKDEVRSRVLQSDQRYDGRGLDEIREISVDVSLLPRVHGSGLFNRGYTQVLSAVTLGSPAKQLLVESMEGEDSQRYMHHYNFPAFSTGETGRYNFMPGRREIGHGALAERALIPVLPEEAEFPYTIRVVSEVLSSDGSTSMASTCASTLALMDAGVPIKKPVAGIAMGLISDGSTYKVLTDIAGFEDHIGDMDFKVTGTRDGITAIQMDNKLKGVPMEVLGEGILKAKEARLKILEIMEAKISAPNGKLSKYAPKLITITISKEKIGELIGPGGKVIKKIIEDTGADINIDDDGVVTIAHSDDEAIEKAKAIVLSIVEEAEIGKVYEGTVDKIMPYGAFVDVSPSISGLLHISEIKDGFVKDVSEFLKEGQKVKVKVTKIENGKISFSMKGVE